jgi:DNA-binding response OmpR family regulator
MARILVIDDQKSILDIVRAFLTPHGHDVVLAETGARGMAEIDADGFALVITDLLMPGTDGIEILREVRRRCADLPVIVMSGGGMTEAQPILNLLPGLGADRILQKPFNRDRLLALVQELAG